MHHTIYYLTYIYDIQCSIPVFEDLLPKEHNEILLTLLFHLGHWHALAKLRLHTELSLNLMDEVTVILGQSLRDFQEKTCSAYDTRELQREAGARRKRQAKAAAARDREKSQQAAQALGDVSVTSGTANTTLGSEDVPSNDKTVEVSTTKPGKKRKRTTKGSKQNPDSDEVPLPSDRLARLKKPLNLNTYKNHSLGDYTAAIRRYGTTDSYSTESVFVFTLFRRVLAYFNGFRENLNTEHQSDGTCGQAEKAFLNR